MRRAIHSLVPAFTQKAQAGIDLGPLALQAEALPLRQLTDGNQIDATYTNNDGCRGQKLLRSYPVRTFNDQSHQFSMWLI